MILGMCLFIVSFILVFSSSYLITSLLAEKNSPLGLLYIPIIAFSQVILTFEILSLFSAIKIPFVLILNIVFSLITFYIWSKKNKPLWFFDKEVLKRFFTRLKNALKLDKTLIVLGLCFMVFILTALFLAIIMPVTSGDGKVYHVARSFFFVLNGNLNHFIINDIRALCLPINSEIVYAWIILFLKKDICIAVFSFIGYLITITALFDIMGYLHFAYRRRLWVIFLLSSLASVLVQASSTETDIVITSLVLSSIYMFWTGLKTNKKIPVFMAALSYALAIGTKTPSIIMIPAVGFFMVTLCFYYRRFKPLFEFLGFGVINFIIFSSYNYILNFIDYKNIAGPEYFMIVSKNYYGIKGACANFIKYIFMLFDFTGFKWSDYMMEDLLKIKDSVLTFFGLQEVKDGLYTSGIYFQRSLIDQLMGAGILGFLTYLPCWIWSLFNGFSKNKFKKMLFLYGFIFLINLIVISFSLSYMAYSVRFVMEFMVISAPILAYSYFSNKNPLKYIIIYFSIYYLACVSTHIWARPVKKIVNTLKQTHSVSQLRNIIICTNYGAFEDDRIDCKTINHIKQYKPDTKILLMTEAETNYVGLGKIMLDGYQIDIAEPELLSFKDTDFNNYDLIITPLTRQRSTVIKDYENRKDDCVVDVKRKIVQVVKKRDYDCFYEYNSKISLYDKNGERRLPFAVTCNVNKNYIESKGFHLTRIVGSQDPASENGDYKYTLFFQNNNKEQKIKN